MENDNNTIHDCWNKIGVWRTNDEICPTLSNVIHCRNCKTYVDSGLSLLNISYSNDYCSNNTKIYKQKAESKTNEKVSVIIFRSQKNWFALKTSIFTEIDNNKTVHSIPHNKNHFIKGLVNIRGELELCISLSSLISQTHKHTDSPTNKVKLIIIKLDSGKYAFKPEEILGVHSINNNEIKSAANIITGDRDHLVSGSFDFNEKHIGLIDEGLLNSKLGTLRT